MVSVNFLDFKILSSVQVRSSEGLTYGNLSPNSINDIVAEVAQGGLLFNLMDFDITAKNLKNQPDINNRDYSHEEVSSARNKR